MRNQTAAVLGATRHSTLAAHWVEIKGWVLFYPHLHPANKPMPTTRRDHWWLHLAGVDDIVELVFAADSHLRLQRQEITRVTRQVFKGKPRV